MASLDLNHLGTGSLRHESLKLRSDHVIFCGQQIPARLRLPGSRCGPGVRGGKSPRHLGFGHEICNLGLYVSGERCCKLLAVKKQEAVLWRQNRGSRCIRRSSLDERKDGITGVSSECTYVNKPGDLRVISHRADHHTAIRMAHEDHRAVLRVDGSLRHCNVIRKRGCGVLDNRNVIALLRENLVDAFPSGSVHEASVDENDIFYSP